LGEAGNAGTHSAASLVAANSVPAPEFRALALRWIRWEANGANNEPDWKSSLLTQLLLRVLTAAHGPQPTVLNKFL